MIHIPDVQRLQALLSSSFQQKAICKMLTLDIVPFSMSLRLLQINLQIYIRTILAWPM